jgi:hypothetical protein
MRDDPRRAEAKEGERLRTQLRDRAREGLDCLEVIDGSYQVLRGGSDWNDGPKKEGPGRRGWNDVAMTVWRGDGAGLGGRELPLAGPQ